MYACHSARLVSHFSPLGVLETRAALIYIRAGANFIFAELKGKKPEGRNINGRENRCGRPVFRNSLEKLARQVSHGFVSAPRKQKARRSLRPRARGARCKSRWKFEIYMRKLCTVRRNASPAERPGRWNDNAGKIGRLNASPR